VQKIRAVAGLVIVGGAFLLASPAAAEASTTMCPTGVDAALECLSGNPASGDSWCALDSFVGGGSGNQCTLSCNWSCYNF
jgi:hypothetical protein